MIEEIKSQIKVLLINIDRLGDHAYRRITGLPTLKRSKITSDLYLGGQYNLQGLHKLTKLGITGIINMRTTSIHREAKIEGFRYLHLSTVDQTAPTMENLLKGVKFANEIIENGGRIYVHCRAGEGRGPSMAIAYLISTGLTYDDAFNQVKKVRVFIRPTPPQIERLKEFEIYYREKEKEVKNK